MKRGRAVMAAEVPGRWLRVPCPDVRHGGSKTQFLHSWCLTASCSVWAPGKWGENLSHWPLSRNAWNSEVLWVGCFFPQLLESLQCELEGLAWWALVRLQKGHCSCQIRIPQVWETWRRVKWWEGNVWGGAGPCSRVWVVGTAAWCQVPGDPVTFASVHLKGKTS